jgi:hypothetical protein
LPGENSILPQQLLRCQQFRPVAVGGSKLHQLLAVKFCLGRIARPLRGRQRKGRSAPRAKPGRDSLPAGQTTVAKLTNELMTSHFGVDIVAHVAVGV